MRVLEEYWLPNALYRRRTDAGACLRSVSG